MVGPVTVQRANRILIAEADIAVRSAAISQRSCRRPIRALCRAIGIVRTAELFLVSEALLPLMTAYSRQSEPKAFQNPDLADAHVAQLPRAGAWHWGAFR